jgi:sulfate transport system permease protein
MTRSLPWGRWGRRGVMALYLVFIVAVPLAAVVSRGFEAGLAEFWHEVRAPEAFAALRLTIVAALAMTVINVVMGTLTAYVLARFEFPGRRLLDGLVELPFAIPTLVTGVMLVVLYGPQGIFGGWLASHGIPVIFARPGILLALLFVCYPVVIRSVQPVLVDAELSKEEAAYTLGARRAATFRRVVLPTVLPAVVSGALLSFSRALGEFGAIVVVAGNIPGRTLTAPVYIYGQVESQNERSASAVSVALLAISFSLLLILDTVEHRRRRADGL